MKYRKGSTYTSGALGMAEAELKNGRENTRSVVVVITDGNPISQKTTKAAANKLKTQAKLLWVAIGSKAPRTMIEELASKPQKEHVISVPTYDSLRSTNALNNLLNKIITNTC